MADSCEVKKRGRASLELVCFAGFQASSRIFYYVSVHAAPSATGLKPVVPTNSGVLLSLLSTKIAPCKTQETQVPQDPQVLTEQAPS